MQDDELLEVLTELSEYLEEHCNLYGYERHDATQGKRKWRKVVYEGDGMTIERNQDAEPNMENLKVGSIIIVIEPDPRPN